MHNEMTHHCKFFTSYFGNSKHVLHDDPDACLVSIAGITPSWFAGEKFMCLAPKWSWWNEWHSMFKDCIESDESKAWYTEKYTSTVLDKLDAHNVANELALLSSCSTIVLMCYETPEKFCHRHIVASWLCSNGISCNEWKQRNDK